MAEIKRDGQAENPLLDGENALESAESRVDREIAGVKERAERTVRDAEGRARLELAAAESAARRKMEEAAKEADRQASAADEAMSEYVSGRRQWTPEQFGRMKQVIEKDAVVREALLAEAFKPENVRAREENRQLRELAAAAMLRNMDAGKLTLEQEVGAAIWRGDTSSKSGTPDKMAAAVAAEVRAAVARDPFSFDFSKAVTAAAAKLDEGRAWYEKAVGAAKAPAVPQENFARLEGIVKGTAIESKRRELASTLAQAGVKFDAKNFDLGALRKQIDENVADPRLRQIAARQAHEFYAEAGIANSTAKKVDQRQVLAAVTQATVEGKKAEDIVAAVQTLASDGARYGTAESLASAAAQREQEGQRLAEEARAKEIQAAKAKEAKAAQEAREAKLAQDALKKEKSVDDAAVSGSLASLKPGQSVRTDRYEVSKEENGRIVVNFPENETRETFLSASEAKEFVDGLDVFRQLRLGFLVPQALAVAPFLRYMGVNLRDGITPEEKTNLVRVFSRIMDVPADARDFDSAKATFATVDLAEPNGLAGRAKKVGLLTKDGQFTLERFRACLKANGLPDAA